MDPCITRLWSCRSHREMNTGPNSHPEGEPVTHPLGVPWSTSPLGSHAILIANLVTSSKAPVTTSDAPVTSSVLVTTKVKTFSKSLVHEPCHCHSTHLRSSRRGLDTTRYLLEVLRRDGAVPVQVQAQKQFPAVSDVLLREHGHCGANGCPFEPRFRHEHEGFPALFKESGRQKGRSSETS